MTVTQLPPRVHRVDSGTAAELLRAAGPDGRGFFDLDPVTDNDALLARELDRRGVQAVAHGDHLFGYRLNPDQPRQAWVATTSADGPALAQLLRLLATYLRCTSFVATALPDSGPASALRECGFEDVGTMPGHRFESGRFHDVTVYFARCPT